MLPTILITAFLLAIRQQNVAAEVAVADASVYTPNPDGKVVILTGENFSQEVQDHPERSWFIKFYAPWCSHCKSMAPVWVEVAKSLQGQTNIGQVDCTVDEPICRTYGVSGFPTLKYISKDAAVEFRGARDRPTLLSFVDKASNSPLLKVNNAELSAKLNDQDVSFIYVSNGEADANELATIESIGQTFLNDIATYVSSDPEVAARFGIQKSELPKAILWKNSRALTYPSQDFSNTKDNREAIRTWINDRKYPLIFELGPSNSDDVLRGNKMVVLSFLNPSRELENQKQLLKNTAEEYLKAHGEDDGQVLFVWLDGVKHARYVYNVYNFNGNQLPAAVITDAKNRQYFGEDVTGARFDLAAPHNIVKSIADAKAGLLVAKSSIPASQQYAKYIHKGIDKAREYWYIVVPVIVLATGFAVNAIKPLLSSTPDKREEAKSQ